MAARAAFTAPSVYKIIIALSSLVMAVWKTMPAARLLYGNYQSATS